MSKLYSQPVPKALLIVQPIVWIVLCVGGASGIMNRREWQAGHHQEIAVFMILMVVGLIGWFLTAVRVTSVVEANDEELILTTTLGRMTRVPITLVERIKDNGRWVAIIFLSDGRKIRFLPARPLLPRAKPTAVVELMKHVADVQSR